ncbi:M12 family metallo-peptidase [Spirosoma daeguense]
MRIVLCCLVLWSGVGWAQEKPLEKAITQARAAGKTDIFTDLFTANGSTQAVANAQDASQPIDKLTLNPNVLTRIRSKKPKLLEITLPTSGGNLELTLVPVSIFAPNFNVVTRDSNITFRFDVTKFSYYQGVVKNSPRSIVALALADNNVVGLISDSTGNRVLSRQTTKGNSLTTDYVVYNERAVQTKVRPFSCESDDDNKTGLITPASNASKANSSTCVKYVGVYLEADYALYQSYGGNVAELTDDILFVFNQVITLYRNENVYVQLAQLYIWNTPDPYNNPTTSGDALDRFKQHWNSFGNSFPGQVAHLLTSRNIGGGKASGYNGLSDRSTAYAVSSGFYPNVAKQYPTYSWEVNEVAHELGHNFSSRHTHWCGWPGGPIDNCAVPENGPCTAGPAPVNGGTIMSYCYNTSRGVNFANGFGTLPGNQIRNKIASVSLPITTSDGSVESVSSGAWTSASTWTCGVTPTVIYNATISNGNTVQLNTTGTVKALNVNGILDLSTFGSVINVNYD